jgi:hypothetical protein
MPIFDNHKAIFVHIPKCGGGSIWSLFFSEDEIFENITNNRYLSQNNNLLGMHFSDTIDYTHFTSSQIKIYFPLKHKNYYKFSFVRNPYGRLVSVYKDITMRTKYGSNIFSILEGNYDLSFDDFVLKLYDLVINKKFEKYKQAEYSFYIPQHIFLYNNGISMIDDIYKFENYNEEIDKLKKKLGIIQNMNNIHKHETGSFKNYRSYYTNEKIKNKVYDMYKVDFEYFGYSQLLE